MLVAFDERRKQGMQILRGAALALTKLNQCPSCEGSYEAETITLGIGWGFSRAELR